MRRNTKLAKEKFGFWLSPLKQQVLLFSCFWLTGKSKQSKNNKTKRQNSFWLPLLNYSKNMTLLTTNRSSLPTPHVYSLVSHSPMSWLIVLVALFFQNEMWKHIQLFVRTIKQYSLNPLVALFFSYCLEFRKTFSKVAMFYYVCIKWQFILLFILSFCFFAKFYAYGLQWAWRRNFPWKYWPTKSIENITYIGNWWR